MSYWLQYLATNKNCNLYIIYIKMEWEFWVWSFIFSGHYVSDIYNCEEGSWFHYDDETVTKISESVVLADGRQKNGYIFFYVHK